MDKYFRFDIEKFLRDSRNWDKEIKKLEQEQGNLLGLSAISQDTPVQTSNISDSTASVALKRYEIQNELDKLYQYRKVLNIGIASLDEKEKDIIDACFFKTTLIYSNINEFCDKYECEPITAYRVRRRALDKLIRNII